MQTSQNCTIKRLKKSSGTSYYAVLCSCSQLELRITCEIGDGGEQALAAKVYILSNK